MADEIKLSNKARALLGEYDIAKRKQQPDRLKEAALAVRNFAKGQKNDKVRGHLLQHVGSDDNALPKNKGRGGPPNDRWQRGGGTSYGGGQNTATRNQPKADPSILEAPFHNPYTFVRFTKDAPSRNEPTFLTADESEKSDHVTGILDLRLRTKSPLLSCEPQFTEQRGHKTYSALSIGPDVIVPATGVRGALRSLLTIITGSSLITLDRDAYACQGRDAQLGPAGKTSQPNVPVQCFLGRVEKPGGESGSGMIRLGKTDLIPAAELARAVAVMNGDRNASPPREEFAKGKWAGKILERYRGSKAKPLWIFKKNDQIKTSEAEVDGAWQVKLSGRPINPKGKREGRFLADGEVIDVPASYWREYNFRHQHSEKETLKKGDLVWLEPKSSQLTDLKSASDIASLQWARWGRRGLRFAELVPDHVQPSENNQVDIVADLFGQVSGDRDAVVSFASRIRPENLVFEDAATSVESCSLPVLSTPHPGCAAFYRWHTADGNASADEVAPDDVAKKFRGYKVYRTTKERGENAPWRWKTQPIFKTDNAAQPENPHQKMNKSVDLLPEGKNGRLRIAFRSLDVQELSMLVHACRQPWRLGGGKPLGLGLCEVEIVGLSDEMGMTIPIPDPESLPDSWLEQAKWWSKSQEPVERLRYPRAVQENSNHKNRGGHSWFQLFANPAKSEPRQGLEVKHIHGKLESESGRDIVAGQVLPAFDPESIMDDVLFGYDVLPNDEKPFKGRVKSYGEFKEFDPKTVRPDEQSGGNQAYRREDRNRDRDNR